MQMLPSASLHSSWEDEVLVCGSLRAEFPCLGPKEHAFSKIFTSVNKKTEPCGQIVLQNTLAKLNTLCFSVSLLSSRALGCSRGSDCLAYFPKLSDDENACSQSISRD